MAGHATALAPRSEEYESVVYSLQLALQTTAIADVAVWSISNPHATVAFERRMQRRLCLDSFVDINELGEGNAVQDVCKRGFKPKAGGGIEFVVGAVRLKARAGGLQQFLVTRVGVGKAYVVEDDGGGSVTTEVPPGYDSLYVHAPVDADRDGRVTLEEYDVSASHGGRSAASYRHRYIVADPSQALPLYVVHFTLLELEGVSRPKCDSCETNFATVRCDADDANLCDDCDTTVHSASKLLSRHVRTRLGGDASGTVAAKKAACPDHSGGPPVSYFCQICGVPVCVECKMTGSHSRGDAAQHPLVSIQDAYDAAVASALREDPLLEARKRSVAEVIDAIRKKVDAVDANSKAVEEMVYAKLQEVLFHLQDTTQRKMATLLGAELELRRQLERIGWAEGFLRKCADTLTAVEFLTAWSRHIQLRTQLQTEGAVSDSASVLEEVQPDVRLVGHIEVVADEAATQLRSPVARGVQGASAVGSDAIAAGIRSDIAAGDARRTAASASNSNGVATTAWSAALAAEDPEVPPSPAGKALAAAMSRITELSRAQERAQLNVKTAHANLMALTEALATLPPHMKERGEAARKQAEEQLRDAESFEAAQIQASASAFLEAAQEQARLSGLMASAASGGGGAGGGTRAGPPSKLSLDPTTPGAMTATPARSELLLSPSQDAAKRMAHYSLRKEADRKARTRDLSSLSPAAMFGDSRILSGDEARVLFLCLPTRPGSNPITTLKFSTWNTYPPSIATLAENWPPVGRGPTVVLVRANGLVFGGYASDAWSFSGTWTGSSACFLFSITHDCKIPFHGRVGLREEGEEGTPGRHGAQACTWSNEDTMKFGQGDLVLRGDFSECTSELESAYGVGLRPKSADAKSFLAGAEIFRADEVEVWQIELPRAYGGGYEFY